MQNLVSYHQAANQALNVIAPVNPIKHGYMPFVQAYMMVMRKVRCVYFSLTASDSCYPVALYRVINSLLGEETAL